MVKDLKCPKNKAGKGMVAQMYTARDVTQEDGEKSGEDQDEELTPENGEASKNKELEKRGPYEGSQYSSEGEELDWKEFQYMQMHGDGDHTVCMYAMSTGIEATNRYTVWEEDEMDDIKARNFNEPGSSSSEDEGFPHWSRPVTTSLPSRTACGRAPKRTFQQ
ncbi:hypothetical protein L208DRAFT_1376762 [Tricholoma matsutake]|nr:hypothetical protein L208DRAFT_1376762 [Tricholoma matsutake 945]